MEGWGVGGVGRQGGRLPAQGHVTHPRGTSPLELLFPRQPAGNLPCVLAQSAPGLLFLFPSWVWPCPVRPTGDASSKQWKQQWQSPRPARLRLRPGRSTVGGSQRTHTTPASSPAAPVGSCLSRLGETSEQPQVCSCHHHRTERQAVGDGIGGGKTPLVSRMPLKHGGIAFLSPESRGHQAFPAGPPSPLASPRAPAPGARLARCQLLRQSSELPATWPPPGCWSDVAEHTLLSVLS